MPNERRYDAEIYEKLTEPNLLSEIRARMRYATKASVNRHSTGETATNLRAPVVCSFDSMTRPTTNAMSQ